MALTLDPETEALIRQRVESGQFDSAGDVVAEALRALDEREKLHSLRAKLRAAAEQIDRGEGVELTDEQWQAIRERAIRRAAAGDLPSPDVCP